MHMPFIVELACTAGNAEQLTNKQHAQKTKSPETGGSKVNLGLYEITWYTEYNCTNIVTIFHILIEWG